MWFQPPTVRHKFSNKMAEVIFFISAYALAMARTHEYTRNCCCFCCEGCSSDCDCVCSKLEEQANYIVHKVKLSILEFNIDYSIRLEYVSQYNSIRAARVA